MNQYDAVPYNSRAIPPTHPDRLALAALLAGFEPAPVESCRVLEIGCAEAANLVAMAFHARLESPGDGARFVGLDSSRRQIEHARELASELELDNLELLHGSIVDYDSLELGNFDYIVAHGVLSWVDEPTGAKIFELCRDLLAPQGVAYVSYNCKAGWGVRSLIRQAVLRRVRGVEAADERLRRCRETLAILAGAALSSEPGQGTLQTALLAEQAQKALEHRDEYLFHEYLEPVNRAISFGEFEDLAQAHDLAFLAEVSQPLQRKGEDDIVRSALALQIDDPTEVEELADLIMSRSYRATLLCRRDVQPEDPDAAAELRRVADGAFFAGALQPEQREITIDPGVEAAFFSPDGAKVATSEPLLKQALLDIWHAWPRGVSLSHIAATHQVEQRDMDLLCEDLLSIQRGGLLELRLRDPQVLGKPGETPAVSALTRLEASSDEFVTNAHHLAIKLDPFARELVAHLDGTRDVSALAEQLVACFDSGDLVAQGPNGVPMEGETLIAALPGMVQNMLGGLAYNALLR